MQAPDFKDLFSRQATDYARFRPTYPPALFDWLAEVTPTHELAVDVGAGSGQAAIPLAARFARVVGLEPSQAQLSQAPASERLVYRQGSAEATLLDPATVDLLVAAQAFHWFKHQAFFDEVRRVVRPGGTLALWCYAVATITPAIDALVHELYEPILGPFWEPERRLVETGYATVVVPFAELSPPSFEMRLSWTFQHLLGYLTTWSSLQRYLRERGDNPLQALFPRLQAAWGGAAERPVTWPLYVRGFRV